MKPDDPISSVEDADKPRRYRVLENTSADDLRVQLLVETESAGRMGIVLPALLAGDHLRISFPKN